MEKEILSISMAKLIIAVVLIVGIGTMLGILVYSETMPKSEVAIDNKTEQEQKITNAQQLLLFDEEIYEILKEFAVKPNAANISDGNILLDAIEFQNGGIKERLEKIEYDLKEIEKALADAIDMRGYINAATKVCIARSIIYDDLKHTCNLKDDSFVLMEDIDDITAVEEIIPYFLAGFAYFKDGEYDKASYYLNQIALHRQAEIDRWGESYFLDASGEVYGKIYKKTTEVLNKIETSDWQTYRNEEFGFEVKYPRGMDKKN